MTTSKRRESWLMRAPCLVACLALLGSCSSGDTQPATPTPPSATTSGAKLASDSQQTLSGSVNPNGKETEYWFEWGADPALTNPSKTTVQVLAASSTPQAVNANATNLAKASHFHYRLCARNADGTICGEVKPAYHYANVVFTTSVEGSGNLSGWSDAGGKTGLAAGDAICQSLADRAGLQGTFKAWLSDKSASAKDRLAHSMAPYVRVDGVQVASSWSDFTADHALSNAISVTETGWSEMTPPYWVWTETSVEGGYGYGSACKNWTSASNPDSATVGGDIYSDKRWTEWGMGRCDGTHPLYCMEQDLGLPQEDASTGCPGPWGWVWHVSACSKGLFQDPDCKYVCCNFYNGTKNCDVIPGSFGGYTVNSCDYNTGRYGMAVTHGSESFNVTCEVE